MVCLPLLDTGSLDSCDVATAPQGGVANPGSLIMKKKNHNLFYFVPTGDYTAPTFRVFITSIQPGTNTGTLSDCPGR